MSSLPTRRPALSYPPFAELTKLVYGEPKVGKTSFCDSTPDSLFLATEPGHDFVKSPVVRITSWGWDVDKAGKPKPLGHLPYVPPRVDEKTGIVYTNFKDFVREIYQARAQKTLSFKAAVVDIVDNLYSMCLNAVCVGKGIDYPPENDFGKTWKEIREEWELWVRRLLDALNVTFVTHTTTDKVEVKGSNGITKEIERRIPTFKGNKAAQFLDGIINVMGFAHFGPEGQRQIVFSGSPSLATGDRTGILEKVGVLPLSFEACAKAYEAKAKEMNINIASKWA